MYDFFIYVCVKIVPRFLEYPRIIGYILVYF